MEHTKLACQQRPRNVHTSDVAVSITFVAGKHRIWPSRDELETLLSRHDSWDSAALELGVPRTTLNSHCRALKLAAPSKSDSRAVESLTVKNMDLGDIRRLIESRGLNPDEYELTNIRLNEWGRCATCDTAQEQNRVDLKPRVVSRAVGWLAATHGQSFGVDQRGRVDRSHGRLPRPSARSRTFGLRSRVDARASP